MGGASHACSTTQRVLRRARFGSAIVGSKIYVYGGVDDPLGLPLGDTMVYDIPTVRARWPSQALGCARRRARTGGERGALRRLGAWCRAEHVDRLGGPPQQAPLRRVLGRHQRPGEQCGQSLPLAGALSRMRNPSWSVRTLCAGVDAVARAHAHRWLQIYTAGGYDTSFNTLGSIEVYNPASDQWTELPTSLKLPRSATVRAAGTCTLERLGLTWRARRGARFLLPQGRLQRRGHRQPAVRGGRHAAGARLQHQQRHLVSQARRT